MYRLKYSRRARNYIARLSLKSKSAIVNKLHQLAENPENPELDIAVLKGRIGFRLRVGKYRVVYSRHDDILIIKVIRIRSRGDIYKG